MANGEMLQEIRNILSGEGNIPQREMFRLILAVQAEILVSQKDAAEKEDGRHKKLDEELKIVKDKSIVIWVERNKPVASLIVFLLFVVFLVAQSIVVPVIAKAFGMPI